MFLSKKKKKQQQQQLGNIKTKWHSYPLTHSTCTSGFVRTYPFFISFATKGMVRPNGCHNFIDLRKRAKLDIIAIKSDSTSFENPCSLANDRHSKLNGISRSHLHAQLINFLGKKTQTVNQKFYHIFKAPSNWM